MTLDAQRADFRIHLLLLDCLLVRISLKSDASCYFAYLYLSLILFLFLILLLLFSSISLYLYNFLFSLLIFFLPLHRLADIWSKEGIHCRCLLFHWGYWNDPNFKAQAISHLKFPVFRNYHMSAFMNRDYKYWLFKQTPVL